ncbi:hypothetical protein PPERSA_05486 [Pseudocohnilembus persalinus]|uniref:Uncharacterized protein n=1 Tax=Pseudocohnilembus persalinus TaxID=266149 RepID=A0A0V0QCZ1_PSEPJ|nr:hypothetical protein PPERSA_05486 [Pseudocohnilembus persalinus]|eukprot:KRW99983.1 hypothetical protein PPERSA_05486 [Pseudocohnilembus persalinus]
MQRNWNVIKDIVDFSVFIRKNEEQYEKQLNEFRDIFQQKMKTNQIQQIKKWEEKKKKQQQQQNSLLNQIQNLINMLKKIFKNQRLNEQNDELYQIQKSEKVKKLQLPYGNFLYSPEVLSYDQIKYDFLVYRQEEMKKEMQFQRQLTLLIKNQFRKNPKKQVLDEYSPIMVLQQNEVMRDRQIGRYSSLYQFQVEQQNKTQQNLLDQEESQNVISGIDISTSNIGLVNSNNKDKKIIIKKGGEKQIKEIKYINKLQIQQDETKITSNSQQEQIYDSPLKKKRKQIDLLKCTKDYLDIQNFKNQGQSSENFKNQLDVKFTE